MSGLDGNNRIDEVVCIVLKLPQVMFVQILLDGSKSQGPQRFSLPTLQVRFRAGSVFLFFSVCVCVCVYLA